MVRIIIIAAPNTLSKQLAALQHTGICPDGPPIKWDSRDDHHADYLAVKK